MATRGYKTIDAKNPRGGYRKPSIITAKILDHINGHFVKPNKLALEYPDFKKDVDLNAHVKMFNSRVKANAKTSKKYIINAFNSKLKDIALD